MNNTLNLNVNPNNAVKNLGLMDKSLGAVGFAMDSLKNSIQGLAYFGGFSYFMHRVKYMSDTLLGIASDAQETHGKFRAVFKNLTNDASAMAAELHRNFNFSIQQAEEGLANMANTFYKAGVNLSTALDYASQLTKRAADVQAFQNIDDINRITDAMVAGMNGMGQRLRNLGIMVYQADVKVEMLRQSQMGLVFANEKAAKMAATYSLIMKQSATSAGQVAREHDNLANRQRALHSALQNTKASFGTLLIGPATQITNAMAKVAEVTDRFSDSTKKTIGSIVVFGGAFLLLWRWLAKTRRAYAAYQATMNTAKATEAVAASMQEGNAAALNLESTALGNNTAVNNANSTATSQNSSVVGYNTDLLGFNMSAIHANSIALEKSAGMRNFHSHMIGKEAKVIDHRNLMDYHQIKVMSAVVKAKVKEQDCRLHHIKMLVKEIELLETQIRQYKNLATAAAYSNAITRKQSSGVALAEMRAVQAQLEPMMVNAMKTTASAIRTKVEAQVLQDATNVKFQNGLQNEANAAQSSAYKGHGVMNLLNDALMLKMTKDMFFSGSSAGAGAGAGTGGNKVPKPKPNKLPMLGNLLNFFTYMPGLNKFGKALRPLGKIFTKLGQTASKLVTPLFKIETKAGMLGKVLPALLSALTSPIGLFIAGITALWGALKLCAKAPYLLESFLDTGWDTTKEFIFKAAKWTRNILRKVVIGTVKYIKKLFFDAIKGQFQFFLRIAGKDNGIKRARQLEAAEKRLNEARQKQLAAARRVKLAEEELEAVRKGIEMSKIGQHNELGTEFGGPGAQLLQAVQKFEKSTTALYGNKYLQTKKFEDLSQEEKDSINTLDGAKIYGAEKMLQVEADRNKDLEKFGAAEAKASSGYEERIAKTKERLGKSTDFDDLAKALSKEARTKDEKQAFLDIKTLYGAKSTNLFNARSYDEYLRKALDDANQRGGEVNLLSEKQFKILSDKDRLDNIHSQTGLQMDSFKTLAYDPDQYIAKSLLSSKLATDITGAPQYELNEEEQHAWQRGMELFVAQQGTILKQTDSQIEDLRSKLAEATEDEVEGLKKQIAEKEYARKSIEKYATKEAIEKWEQEDAKGFHAAMAVTGQLEADSKSPMQALMNAGTANRGTLKGNVDEARTDQTAGLKEKISAQRQLDMEVLQSNNKAIQSRIDTVSSTKNYQEYKTNLKEQQSWTTADQIEISKTRGNTQKEYLSQIKESLGFSSIDNEETIGNSFQEKRDEIVKKLADLNQQKSALNGAYESTAQFFVGSENWLKYVKFDKEGNLLDKEAIAKAFAADGKTLTDELWTQMQTQTKDLEGSYKGMFEDLRKKGVTKLLISNIETGEMEERTLDDIQNNFTQQEVLQMLGYLGETYGALVHNIQMGEESLSSLNTQQEAFQSANIEFLQADKAQKEATMRERMRIADIEYQDQQRYYELVDYYHSVEQSNLQNLSAQAQSIYDLSTMKGGLGELPDWRNALGPYGDYVNSVQEEVNNFQKNWNYGLSSELMNMYVKKAAQQAQSQANMDIIQQQFEENRYKNEEAERKLFGVSQTDTEKQQELESKWQKAKAKADKKKETISEEDVFSAEELEFRKWYLEQAQGENSIDAKYRSGNATEEEQQIYERYRGQLDTTNTRWRELTDQMRQASQDYESQMLQVETEMYQKRLELATQATGPYIEKLRGGFDALKQENKDALNGIAGSSAIKKGSNEAFNIASKVYDGGPRKSMEQNVRKIEKYVKSVEENLARYLADNASDMQLSLY